MAGQAGHDERSGDSRRVRHGGGEATDGGRRETQSPGGKESNDVELPTAAELKCWSLSTSRPTTYLH